jgi:hypothetical protein
MRKPCAICLEEFNLDNLLSFPNCLHTGEICRRCFNENVDVAIQESNIGNIKKCPICGAEIPGFYLMHLLPPKVIDRLSYYSVIAQGIKVIECKRCREKFEPGLQRKITCPNQQCQYVFCKQCSEDFHDMGDCQESFLQARIKDLQNMKEPDGVAQCPGCRWPYTKDPKNCEHVTCLNPECSIDFCFRCSCIRSPTLVHGNHFHRPICKWYAKFDGEDDKYDEKCTECKKAKKLCLPPKDLKVPRMVAPDEVIR